MLRVGSPGLESYCYSYSKGTEFRLLDVRRPIGSGIDCESVSVRDLGLRAGVRTRTITCTPVRIPLTERGFNLAKREIRCVLD